MVVTGHKVSIRLDENEFFTNLKDYDHKNIHLTSHALFRLSDKQKQDYSEDNKLKVYITQELPIFVGVQNNGCYAVYYSINKKEALKMILDMKPNNISIVTLYIIDKVTMPRVNYEK